MNMPIRKIISAKPGRSGGFTLVETLAALAVAAICMAVLTRGFISARASSNIGEVTLRGMTLARTLASEWKDNKLTARAGTRDGFRYRIDIRPVRLRTHPSAFPPAPKPSQTDNSGQNQNQAPQNTAAQAQNPPNQNQPNAGNAGAANNVNKTTNEPPRIVRLQAIISITAPSRRTLNYATSKIEIIH